MVSSKLFFACHEQTIAKTRNANAGYLWNRDQLPDTNKTSPKMDELIYANLSFRGLINYKWQSCAHGNWGGFPQALFKHK